MLTGNREYNEIYKKYKNLVLKVAYIYSGDNYDAAEDITQDTFLKLYIGFEELKDGNVSAWLYTTAKKFCAEILIRSSKGKCCLKMMNCIKTKSSLEKA